jgi:hypothetical protein
MTKKIKLEFTEKQIQNIISDFIPKMDIPFIGRDYTVMINSIEKQLKEIGKEYLLEKNES